MVNGQNGSIGAIFIRHVKRTWGGRDLVSVKAFSCDGEACVVCGILGSIEREKKRTSQPKGGLRWISFETSKAKAAVYAEAR